jgi:hypothetical protein
MKTIKESLMDISMNMNDGYLFIKVLAAVRGLQEEARAGNEKAKRLLNVIIQFDAMLEAIKIHK